MPVDDEVREEFWSLEVREVHIPSKGQIVPEDPLRNAVGYVASWRHQGEMTLTLVLNASVLPGGGGIAVTLTRRHPVTHEFQELACRRDRDASPESLEQAFSEISPQLPLPSGYEQDWLNARTIAYSPPESVSL